MSKILGIDYGEKHIGLAVSDDEKKWVFPYSRIEKKSWEQVFEELKIICEKENIEKIVVGLPLSLKENRNEKAKKIQDFIGRLEETVNIPADFEDERFTTKASEQLLKQAGKKKLKDKVDETAAVLILQSYLEKNKNE
ncbi:MAG: Holliday junction resolvase RuvX [Candidatus Kerfeldbacteria bacterium CG_4_10_14_0_8_um_filter_42_10]|uniref:Putative pre-16S rRNA nuclease n=1 Tax=Candidatus Kerfeldbacteria bacterium CG_4_10_14_0_8_um_filter_42_10 TaxID=2014248 RepID=A0A2M7RHX2_9BACT|nr:MAG: Holliday junction resolvase RuvX [Candidatus Kerfeldbacteria bacterium CG_4_10_14_0_8_um_filter_42_10]